MSLIKRNDYGAIAINNKVIHKMILDELDNMSDKILLCNKKGKILKESPAPFIENYLDAVDITENKKTTKVRIYIITKFGDTASNIADEIIAKVEDIYTLLSIDKPDSIDVGIKGLMSDQLIKKNIEVSRKNG